MREREREGERVREREKDKALGVVVYFYQRRERSVWQEMKSLVFPFQRTSGSEGSVCVCVCVCVRERERESCVTNLKTLQGPLVNLTDITVHCITSTLKSPHHIVWISVNYCL